MITISLNEWLTITATSGMPLYAVLSNVSDAQTVKNYYVTDGSQTPYGLYSQTPYENWFSVMPMLIKLEENSPFINWASQTEYQDWGWFARSHLPFSTICDHLRSLTQIIMPAGETAFFRYWDGEYLATMLDFFGPAWQDILPAFAFYWVNQRSQVINVPLEQPVKYSPWWQIPISLIEKLTQTNLNPLIKNILLWLKENQLPLYEAFPESLISEKIARLAEPVKGQLSDYKVIDTLMINLQQELQLASNPFEVINN